MSISDLIRRVEEAGSEIFWQGGASQSTISRLQSILGVPLPPTFVNFLSEYGGGGVVGDEISGVEDDDAENENRGTVLGDTNYCRAEFSLPKSLIVVYLRDDEVVWCLDSSDVSKSGEYSVVSYDVHKKQTSRRLFDDFDSYFVDYLTRYAEGV